MGTRGGNVLASGLQAEAGARRVRRRTNRRRSARRRISWRGRSPVRAGRCAIDSRKLDRYDNLILLCRHHHGDGGPAAADAPRGGPADVEGGARSWVAAATADAPRDVPWTAIVQEEGQRIDVSEASGALGPGNRARQLVELRSDPAREGWTQAASREWRIVELMLTTTPAENRRFAVFSMARIPLAVQLGYRLADRARVALFQYDRDRGSWAWEAAAADTAPLTCEVSRCVAGTADEAAIRVSLSAEVPAEPGVAMRGGSRHPGRDAFGAVAARAGAVDRAGARVRAGAGEDSRPGMPAHSPLLRGSRGGRGGVRARVQSTDESAAGTLRIQARGDSVLRPGADAQSKLMGYLEDVLESQRVDGAVEAAVRARRVGYRGDPRGAGGRRDSTTAGRTRKRR